MEKFIKYWNTEVTRLKNHWANINDVYAIRDKEDFLKKSNELYKNFTPAEKELIRLRTVRLY